LQALSLWLRDLMAVAAGAPEHTAYTDDAALLGSIVKKARVQPNASRPRSCAFRRRTTRRRAT
jgi:hypothetical protein